MKFQDFSPLSGVERADGGYLLANVQIARTGIQDYAGHEVGRPDMPVVRVYRPKEQVHARDSLNTFPLIPLTLGHPDEPVTAETYDAENVGTVIDVVPDGEVVRASIKIMSKRAIDAVERGLRQLSVGYDTKLKWQSGVTADGQPYDAIQQDIRANHLAIVQAGRAGPEYRIGDTADKWGIAPLTNDEKPKEAILADTLTNVVLGDKAVPIAAVHAATLEAFKADKATELKLANDLHDTAIAAKDAELATKDAKIAELEAAALTADALDAKVAERAALVDTAKRVAPKVETKGLTDAAIRKAAVVAVRGADAMAGKSDAYIDAAFDLLAEAKPADPLAPALGRMATTQNDGATKVDDAYQAMLADLGSAHKGGAK